jgi:hypothetical protein
MFILMATKKGIYSKEIQKQLGVKRYEPVCSYGSKVAKSNVQ